MDEHLLRIKDLSVEFRTYDGTVKAINRLSLAIPRGQTIGLVGETGAGKTTAALSIMKLIPSPGVVTAGEIWFDGENILNASGERMLKLRGNKISMIFQNPMTSLNPVLTVGQQIAGVIRLHQAVSATAARDQAGAMLEMVGIPRTRLGNYPHEFSGGMRQRVCIAMGLACNPSLLIADEPTTALDVTIQAQILDLLRGLKTKFDTSIIFITHDLGVVADIADYVVVMYAGSVIEQGDIRSIFEDPRHPYTKGLFGCIPDVVSDTERLRLIQGTMPDPMNLPAGCKFCPRCELALPVCRTEEPPLLAVGSEHLVKCFRGDKGGEQHD